MWGNGFYWEQYKDFFSKRGYQCHIPHLRFHDITPSETPDPALGTTGLLDYVDDLENFITRFDEKPIIIGHSMGGLIAQLLAARNLVQSAVLITPAAPSGIFAVKLSVLRTFWRILTTWGFWNKPCRLSFNSAVYSTFHQLPYAEQIRNYNQFVYESGRVIMQIGLWLFDPGKASRVDESLVNCPMFVIAGSRDRMTPPDIVRQVAKKYEPNSLYKEYDQHSHWIIGEPGWEEVAEDICLWLDSTDSAKTD